MMSVITMAVASRRLGLALIRRRSTTSAAKQSMKLR